jgi:hypothetical protein
LTGLAKNCESLVFGVRAATSPAASFLVNSVRNPYEFPDAHEAGGEPDDPSEHTYPCACGDPACLCDDHDPSNVRIGKDWYAEGCAAKHPVVVGDVMAGILADEQQDEFNRTRR